MIQGDEIDQAGVRNASIGRVCHRSVTVLALPFPVPIPVLPVLLHP